MCSCCAHIVCRSVRQMCARSRCTSCADVFVLCAWWEQICSPYEHMRVRILRRDRAHQRDVWGTYRRTMCAGSHTMHTRSTQMCVRYERQKCIACRSNVYRRVMCSESLLDERPVEGSHHGRSSNKAWASGAPALVLDARPSLKFMLSRGGRESNCSWTFAQVGWVQVRWAQLKGRRCDGSPRREVTG